jgi:hypothetical protein
MAIRYVCRCGYPLQIRNGLAARHSVCPMCGSHVDLLGPGRGEREGLPDWVHDRRSRSVLHGPAIGSEGGLENLSRLAPWAREVRLVKICLEATHPWLRQRSGRRQLIFALRAWPVLVGFALVLTVLVGCDAWMVRAVLTEGDIQLARDFRAPVILGFLLFNYAVFFLVPLLVLCYAGAFLNGVLSSAADGRRAVDWLGHFPDVVLRDGVRWLVCFLAGPVVPAAAAFLLWLGGGDQFVDRLILAELGIVAAGYWLLAVLSVGLSGRLGHVDPAHLLRLLRRLGPRMAGALGITSVVVAADGLLLFVALEKVLRGTALGWMLLFACWSTGLFAVTILFRLVGTWAAHGAEKAK